MEYTELQDIAEKECVKSLEEIIKRQERIVIDILKADLSEKEFIYLNDIGETEWIKGNFRDSNTVFRFIYEKIMKDDDLKSSPNMAFFTSNYALSLKHFGCYKDAMQKYEEAESILEKFKFDFPEEFLKIKINKASVYVKQCDFKAAEKMYLSVKDMLSSDDYKTLLLVSGNLGNLYFSMGDYDRALKLFYESLKIICGKYGYKNMQYVRLLNNSAMAYFKLWKSESVLKMLNKAIETINDINSSTPYKYILITNKAHVYKELSRFWESRSLLSKIEHKTERHFGKTKIHYTILKNLGFTNHKIGDYLLAEHYYEKAHRLICSESLFSFDCAEFLMEYSFFQKALGNTADSYKFMKKSALIMNKLIIQVLNGMVSEENLMLLISKFDDNTQYALDFIRETQLSKPLLKELYPIIAFRKSLAGNIFKTHMKEFKNTVENKPDELLQSLRETRKTYSNMIIHGCSENESIELFNKRMKNLEEEKTLLEAELGYTIHSKNVELAINRLTFDEIMENLHEDELFLDFYETQNSRKTSEYNCFVLSKSMNYFEFIQLGNSCLIDVAVKEICDKSASPEFINSSRKLYGILMKKFKRYFENNNIKKLIISPTGFLNRIPFEALVDDDGRYLIEKYELIYTEPASIKNNSNNPTKFKGACLLSLPDEDLDNNMRKNKKNLIGPFPKMEYSKKEINDIQSILLRESFIPVENLTTSKVYSIDFRIFKNKSVVHFSAHGYYIESDKVPFHLKYGLFLGKNEEGQQLKTLTHYDVMEADLSDTDLVVLSACSTGFGKSNQFEGVIALKRTFLMSGVRTVISSLWDIPDEYSSEIMINMYQELFKKGNDVGNSLRNSKLYIIDKLRRKFGYAPPFLWAGFIVSGDPKLRFVK